MEDDVVIKVRGLKKSYTIIDKNVTIGHLFKKNKTQYPIFDGIDLDVHRGDIMAILGRNGCGKSTFLKLVSEILEPDEGTVEVHGKIASILRKKDHQRAAEILFRRPRIDECRPQFQRDEAPCPH